MRSPADPADEEQPSDGGLDAEDIKFLRSLRTSATPGQSSDGETAAERSGIARRLSSRTVKKLEVASDEIELQPSVWDSALFQFASVSGRGASVFTLVLLVVNILMQGSFAFYLMDGLTEKPITHNDIDELHWWRRNVAHSLEYYSEAKGESLARRVCDNDFGIEASGVQAGLHATLNEYLGDYFKRSEKDYFGVGPGEYVAMLAVCLWVISVFLDARAALDTLAALQSLPRAWKSEIRLNGDAEVEVARISHARFAACVLVQLVRLVIGGILLWYGSLYLVYTIAINELILNAVALEFVLSIDDIIFACFAPTRMRALIKSAKHLRVRGCKTEGGLDFRSVASFLVCLAFVLTVYFTELIPMKHRLEKAQHAMCGGDLDFVYARDAMGATWWAPTKSQPDAGLAGGMARFGFPDGRTRGDLQEEDPQQRDEYVGGDGKITARGLSSYEFLIDATLMQYGKPWFRERCEYEACFDTRLGKDYAFYRNGLSGCCWAEALRLASPSVVKERAAAPFQDIVQERNPAGVDVLDKFYFGFREFSALVLRSDVFDDGPCRGPHPGGCPFHSPFCDHLTGECVWPTCARVKRFCYDATEVGRRIRALCPETCGCGYPLTDQALTDIEQGCSVDTTGFYHGALRTMPCTDVSAEGDAYDAVALDVMNMTRWAAFQRYLYHKARDSESMPVDLRRQVNVYVGYLKKYGCRYLRDPSVWHTLNSTEDAFRADARNGSKAMPPYLSGRNLCVRGRGGHKPLSLFCPEACGCHRGDRDCSLRCPEREPSTPTCPAHQEAIWVREGRRPGHCPRLPRSQLLDVGVDHGGMMGEMP